MTIVPLAASGTVTAEHLPLPGGGLLLSDNYPATIPNRTEPNTTRIPRMNILLIGASGFIGTALLEEAVARKHKVTAITRHPDKVKALPYYRTATAN